MLKILSWNMAHRSDSWRWLKDIDADVAILQEASEPPADIASCFDIDPGDWKTEGRKNRPWRSALVGLNKDVKIDRINTVPLSDSGDGDFGVSRPGTLAAAHVADPQTAERFTLVSMYAIWESLHRSTGSSEIYADASVHRLISDISVLVGYEKGHRVIAAGDLNILYGYGEYQNRYWETRYKSIFDRFEGIGLKFLGPQSPNGRMAEPWPNELPNDSLNVPTYHTNRQTPATATRQLDFVFGSMDIRDRVQTRALNEVDQWGPSDHCIVKIEVA